MQLWAGLQSLWLIPLGQPLYTRDESICSRELEFAPSGSRPPALSKLCLQLVLFTGHQANPATFLATEWMAGADSGQGRESLERSKLTVAKCACYHRCVCPSGCNNSKTAQRMVLKFGTGGGLLKCERIRTLWYVSPWGMVNTGVGWLYKATILHTATRPDALARACWTKWLNTGLLQMTVGVLTTSHTLEIGVYVFFLFNRTTLHVFVTYFTGALYVHHLWFYKHQHDNRVRSTQNAFSLPFAAILVNCAPSGEMHNCWTPHIIKENWEFLDPSV